MINYLSKINYLPIKLITCQNKLITDQKMIDYMTKSPQYSYCRQPRLWCFGVLHLAWRTQNAFYVLQMSFLLLSTVLLCKTVRFGAFPCCIIIRLTKYTQLYATLSSSNQSSFRH